MVYYGGLKVKRNWLGMINWYAKFNMDDEIKWIKITKKEVKKLLRDYGTRYITQSVNISGIEQTFKIKGYFLFSDNVNDMGFSMYGNTVDLPISIYDTFEMKLIATPKLT